MEQQDQYGDPDTAASSGASAGATGAANEFSTSSRSSNASGGGTESGAMVEAPGRLQHGKEAISSRLGQVKDKAGELKSTLADKLESGADRLRQRSHPGSPELAGAGGEASAAVNERLSQYEGVLATGMEKTAVFLREGDLGGAIEQQVKEHPGRTLLIALGVGYLIGRALKD